MTATPLGISTVKTSFVCKTNFADKTTFADETNFVLEISFVQLSNGPSGTSRRVRVSVVMFDTSEVGLAPF